MSGTCNKVYISIQHLKYSRMGLKITIKDFEFFKIFKKSNPDEQWKTVIKLVSTLTQLFLHLFLHRSA